MIEINRAPTARELKQFAGIWFPLLCGAAGALLYWKGGAPSAAIGVWIGGGVVCAAGLTAPAVIQPLFVGLAYATFPLGWLLSHALLILLYCLVVVPVGLVLRLLGSDPLRRRFEKSATTYWRPHRQSGSKEQYFKQY